MPLSTSCYFDRDRRPVAMDVGPVLDLEDVVGSKICALASRVEPRDYVDTAAVLEQAGLTGAAHTQQARPGRPQPPPRARGGGACGRRLAE